MTSLGELELALFDVEPKLMIPSFCMKETSLCSKPFLHSSPVCLASSFAVFLQKFVTRLCLCKSILLLFSQNFIFSSQAVLSVHSKAYAKFVLLSSRIRGNAVG